MMSPLMGTMDRFRDADPHWHGLCCPSKIKRLTLAMISVLCERLRRILRMLWVLHDTLNYNVSALLLYPGHKPEPQYPGFQ